MDKGSEFYWEQAVRFFLFHANDEVMYENCTEMFDTKVE